MSVQYSRYCGRTQGCFDVREASNFWLMIRTLNVFNDEVSVHEFASTHPSEETRYNRLDSLTDDVNKLKGFGQEDFTLTVNSCFRL